jgi:4,5-DOPA dioxygenase extradiol
MKLNELNKITKPFNSTEKMPVLFLGHGSPMNAIEENEFVAGFPKALSDVQYPAPGSPELALEIKNIKKKTGVGLDYKWGLDHGAWSMIKHLYPDADVPVIQLSLDYMQTPQYHYDLAKELSLLRNKGVLIIGSGNMVHNLSLIAWDKLNADEYGYDWAIEASEKMKNYILAGDHKQLINYRSR